VSYPAFSGRFKSIKGSGVEFISAASQAHQFRQLQHDLLWDQLHRKSLRQHQRNRYTNMEPSRRYRGGRHVDGTAPHRGTDNYRQLLAEH